MSGRSDAEGFPQPGACVSPPPVERRDKAGAGVQPHCIRLMIAHDGAFCPGCAHSQITDPPHIRRPTVRTAAAAAALRTLMMAPVMERRAFTSAASLHAIGMASLQHAGVAACRQLLSNEISYSATGQKHRCTFCRNYSTMARKWPSQ